MNMSVHYKEFNGSNKKRAISTSTHPDGMIRRSLIGGIPAFSFGALVAAGASPVKADEADTPILRLFRQHRAIIDAVRDYTPVSTGKAEDAEMERLFYCRSDKIEDEMMGLPCT